MILIFSTKQNDPVKGCDVYKEIGCTHVDSCLCDYPRCSMLLEYREGKKG